MPKLPFYWIDVFTEKTRAGNPCAVVLDADSLDTEEMRSIAREMNLSETAFVTSSRTSTFGARYFTPHEELPFAGHPTIAVTRAMIEAGRIPITGPRIEITIELPAGRIPVEIVPEAGDSRIVMSQLSPRFLRTYDPAEICAIYDLTPGDLLKGAPIQTVSTGTPILMVPLANREVVGRVRYADRERYARLKQAGDFRFPYHFTAEGATPRGSTYARCLGAPPDGLEDPFTGSATGCMAAYLWKYGLLPSSRFIAEQGHGMGRPGEAEVEVIGPPDAIETVRVGGRAVTLVKGTIAI